MAKLPVSLITLSILLVSYSFVPGANAATFTIVNQCEQTVWPGILTNAGVPTLSPTGFALQKGETRSLTVPASWGGRLWGRALCSQDSSNGKFVCATGDCGSGQIECSGSGANPPATLAEFTLNGHEGLDFYDVSLVDGYNLPMLVVPQGGSGQNCSSTGCMVDLNGPCPSELRVVASAGGGGVACKSACEAFKEDRYCCSGAYGSPNTCQPSSYSQIFKTACPRAYSYAYDDKSSTFTCAGSPDYVITFCPSPATSQKSSQDQTAEATTTSITHPPPQDATMVYEGAFDQTAASPPSLMRPTSWGPILATAGAIAALGLWRLF